MTITLDNIKINTNDYIEEYKIKFNSLINQKAKDRAHKIDLLITEIKDKKIFVINGDDDFKEKTYNLISELLEVKPGRLLIKELIKYCTSFPGIRPSVKIESGKFFWYDDSVVTINLNKNEADNYNAMSALKVQCCSKPKSVNLFHELVHELQAKEEEMQSVARERFLPDSIKDYFIKNKFEIYPNPQFHSFGLEGFEAEAIFRGLDNLKEEHTILGINIPRFLKKKRIDKSDLLCENVFLCALNLLPRIDHQRAKYDNIEENIQLSRADLASYYDWLSQRLDERNEQVAQAFLFAQKDLGPDTKQTNEQVAQVSQTSADVKPMAPKMRVLARCDVKFGNKLFIRGEGIPNLNWKKGIEMTCVQAPDLWAVEFDSADLSGSQFKFLVNDDEQFWENGDNHRFGSKKSEEEFKASF